jgi:uncharacterized membrane protein
MFSVALATMGLMMCTYLVLWKWGMLGPLACGTGGCETVQLSKWGDLFGLPVALYGVVGYLAVLVVGMVGIQPRWQNRPEPAKWMFFLALGGVLFSAYLTSLEAFVIHAWCQWCLGSAATISIIFVLTAIDWRRHSSAGE